MLVELRWQLRGLLLLGACLATTAVAQQSEDARDQNRAIERDDKSRESRLGRQRDAQPRSEERGIRLVDPQLWPPVSDRDRYWFLGVKVEYRDHGAQITHVERRSPAHRSGLEVRDVIVNVAGYQVGKVNGRLYPLERELALRADRRGNVGLLVHNHRNGELALLPVRMEPIERRRDPTVARPLIGTIRSRRITSLASNAVLQVRLLELTDRRTLARVVTQRVYRDLGPFPIPFELTYEPQDIDPGRKYALEAEVTVNGFGALRTTQRQQVFEAAEQGRVDLVVEPVRR